MVTGSSCMAAEHKPSTFDEDVAFLKKHTDVVVLKNNGRQVAVVPQYQGRVMTSTTSAGSGASFGWLNYKVIEKGLLSDKEKVGKLEDHIYVFGGEERFWLGPEGGQFSIFFKPGDPFEFAKWKTPAAIDTHPYKVVGQTKDSIVFTHDCELLNHSGTTLSVGIKRTVRLVSEAEVSKMLKMPLPSGIEFVAYESDNVVINKGNKAWTKQTGMLSIWILGMYKPSPETVVVIPFVSGPVKDLGPRVNDAYFGKVPSDYIRVEKDKVFFKGDGTRRGKIGISPERSMGIAGSYDTAGKTLTLVTYNVPDKHQGYVNSMWELQKNPFDGDALNAYNDGSPGPGLKPLGPFYELETSSPAAALATNESMRHVQRTIHITGPEKQLNDIAKTMLHVSLKEIKEAFK
ncbi:MAG: hypothetical protein KJO79_01195 [Verrucomicrobiae bacterium]|nr:hypothetical protein [Verrucomicrobiae bacterium]NNJ85761.1 hypothetical protein [Akkermansiaceae bacterium]